MKKKNKLVSWTVQYWIGNDGHTYHKASNLIFENGNIDHWENTIAHTDCEKCDTEKRSKAKNKKK